MRGGDNYTESLFSVVHLQEFVPANHRLRPIREWVNEALGEMDSLFSRKYDPGVFGGRPSIAPERLPRAMLLQALFSNRIERQLVEQISNNLLFPWFIGLSVDDTVWNHNVFSKNRDRMLEHDAVTEFFNMVVEMAEVRNQLSGEHLSVDGTLIEAGAANKSVRRKDGLDDDRPTCDWHGARRINAMNASKADPESLRYRKSDAAPAQLSYLGHAMIDSRLALAGNARTTAASETAKQPSC